MSDERDELAREVFIADNSSSPNPAGEWEYAKSHGAQYPVDTAYAYGIADGLLAAGYRKPRAIATAEELDALPVGSVVLADGYRHHANGMPIAFQRWTDGTWHRGARSGDTHPDNIVPAIVLWEPEA